MYNILITDDNRQIAAILSEYAKKNGFKASVALDGEEALNAVKNKKTQLEIEIKKIIHQLNQL